MDTNKPFYDPLITQGRSGNSDSPFVDIQETLYIVNGKALVTEIPDEFHRVKIIESKIPLFEIKKGVPKENEYVVNYNRGYVTFGQLFNGERIVVKYKGTGTQKIPDSRTYLTDDAEFELLSEKLHDLDRKDIETDNRIVNLITNVPQPSEVVDMRVDRNGKVYRVAREYLNMLQKYIEDSFTALDGEKFTNLKDRLLEIERDINTSEQSSKDYIDSVKSLIDIEFSEMNDSLNQVKEDLIELIENTDADFDIAKYHPKFINTVGGIRNAVNQSINLDTDNMHMYTTQSDSLNPEGFYINKLTPSGKYISSMWIKEAGHGTMIAVDKKTVSGKITIWFFHNSIGKMLRYEYKDNYVLTLSEANTLSDYTPCSLREKYFTPSYDEYFDYMCFRRNDGKVEIRKREDVVSKIDNILYSVDIEASEYSDSRPMQGCVSYGAEIYWQSGSSDNVMKIQKYDGVTNTKVTDINVSNIIGEFGIRSFRDSFAEPEGVTYYVNPTTGKHSLIFALSSGGIEKRFHQLYAFTQEGDFWGSLTRIGQQNYALTKADGRALSILDSITSINQIVAPGIYHLTNAQASSLSGFPYPVGDAGWYIEVRPLSQIMGGMQIVTRFSSTNKIFELRRTFELNRETFSYEFGNWTINTSNGQNQEYLDASEWSNKLSNVLFPGEYYVTVPQMTAFTDRPYEDAGARLIVHAPDSDGYVRQEIKRNSNDIIDTHVRNVNLTSKTASSWIHFRQTGANDYSDISLTGGASNPDTDSKWRVANDGKFLIVRGAVTVPSLSSLTKIGTLPNAWKPTMLWEEEQQGVTFQFQADGSILARNTSSESLNVRYNSIVSIY